jgi:hypothetical protein
LCFEENFVAEQLSPTCGKMKEMFLAFFKAFPRESPGTRPDTGLWKTSVLLGAGNTSLQLFVPSDYCD